MIYEVRLRNVTNADFGAWEERIHLRNAKNLKPVTIYNFITYVIADSELDAMKLAVAVGLELQAESVRSVVAKPMMAMRVIQESIALESKNPIVVGHKSAFKIVTEVFKSFKHIKK